MGPEQPEAEKPLTSAEREACADYLAGRGEAAQPAECRQIADAKAALTPAELAECGHLFVFGVPGATAAQCRAHIAQKQAIAEATAPPPALGSPTFIFERPAYEDQPMRMATMLPPDEPIAPRLDVPDAAWWGLVVAGLAGLLLALRLRRRRT